jgi:hypothetical protein
VIVSKKSVRFIYIFRAPTPVTYKSFARYDDLFKWSSWGLSEELQRWRRPSEREG